MQNKLLFIISVPFICVVSFAGCKKDPQVNPPILVAQPVSVAPVKITDSVHPNPSIGNFTISTNSNATQTAILYDVVGRERFSLVINGTTSINADSLPSGMYFLRLVSVTDTIIQKIMIIH